MYYFMIAFCFATLRNRLFCNCSIAVLTWDVNVQFWYFSIAFLRIFTKLNANSPFMCAIGCVQVFSMPFSTFDKINHLLLAQIQAFFFISRFFVFFIELETSMGNHKNGGWILMFWKERRAKLNKMCTCFYWMDICKRTINNVH